MYDGRTHPLIEMRESIYVNSWYITSNFAQNDFDKAIHSGMIVKREGEDAIHDEDSQRGLVSVDDGNVGHGSVPLVHPLSLSQREAIALWDKTRSF